MENVSDGENNCSWRPWISSKKPVSVEDQRKNWYYLDNNTVKMSENTLKNLEKTEIFGHSNFFVKAIN